MSKSKTFFACAIALLFGPLHSLAAQQAAAVPAVTRVPIDTIAGTANYDVILEVPRLSVDSIILEVDSLLVQLSARARAANLVSLNAGASVSIDSVGLQIHGVGAQAFLYIDLDNVGKIVNRVVQTLDRNPEIVTSLLSVVDTTVNTVGGVANTLLQPGGVASQAVGAVGQTLNNVTQPGGLLSQTVNTLGQTVQSLVTPTGQIVRRTLNTAGQVLNTETLGNVLSLPVVQETAGTAGQIVRQVRDQAGNLIEVTLNSAGQVTATRVLQAAAGAVSR